MKQKLPIRVHLCGKLSLDRDCREWGAQRLHVFTPRHDITVALWPGNGAQRYDRATGRWDTHPKGDWSWFAINPATESRGRWERWWRP